MWKAPRAKKLGNKYSNKLIGILLFATIFSGAQPPLFAQENTDDKHEHKEETPPAKGEHDSKMHGDTSKESHEKSAVDPHKKDTSAKHEEKAEHSNKHEEHAEPPEYQERKKIAQYDYDEKLYGQALDNYQKIIADMGKDLSEDEIKSINLKMAHSHFELGQFYKSILLIDPFLGNDKLPIVFQEDNFCSPSISTQKISNILKTPIDKGVKPITTIFPFLILDEEATKENYVDAFNEFLNSEYSCKKLISTYLNTHSWKNQLIYQIPPNGSSLEQKLLARLMLEDLYPLNSYLGNQKTKTSASKNHHDGANQKNLFFYEALYWRSRINLETNYYAFARSGFEEVSSSLNYKENEKIISCLFFKAKSKFCLNQYKIALRELEDLNSLYSNADFYRNNFSEESIFIIGRCYFLLSKFDKAIQKFLTLTAGYDNREPRNKLIRQSYYWLAESYYCKSNLNEAIKSYEVILKYGTFAEKEKAHYGIGWALFEKGDSGSKESSKNHFDILLKDYPNTDYRLKTELKLAEIEIEEGHSERGEKILLDLKNSNQNEEFILKNNNLLKQTDFLIGLLYIKKNDYNKALFHLKRSEDTLDLNLKQKIIMQCGICYKETGDFKKAIYNFTIASEMEVNENTQILANAYLADTYFMRKSNQSDLEIASKIYDSLISQQPNHINNVEWRRKKANVQRQQNMDDEAINTLSKINEEDQINWEYAQLEIGNILMTASPQRFKAAAVHYKTILEKISNKNKKDEALLNYAICLLKSNQGIDAISLFQKNITDSTDENIITDSYQYLAICYEKEKVINKAISVLEESLIKFPKQKKQTFLHKECARLYQMEQNYDSAINHLNIVYSEISDPNSQAEALYQLAGFDLKSSKPNAANIAIDKLKNILQKYEKSPTAPKSAYLLGQLLLSKNNLPEALPYFDMVTNDYHDTEFAMNSLIAIGDFYYQSNQYSKAIETYAKIKYPNSEPSKKIDDIKEAVFMKKSDSHFQLKEYTQAKDGYMILIRMNRENVLYKLRYSKSCLESNLRIADAISILEKIPRQDQSKEIEQLLEQLKEALQKPKK